MPDRHRVLQKLLEKYSLLNCGAEIGVWKGKTSQHLLHTFPELKLFLVDPYKPLKKYNARTCKFETLEDGDAMYNRLVKYFHEQFGDRAIWLRKKSKKAAKEVENKSLDFVFIDGNHAYEYVKQDIELWLPKVREGGIISGHDILKNDVQQAAIEVLGEITREGKNVWYKIVPERQYIPFVQERLTVQVISPDSGRENKGHDHWVWLATNQAIERLGHNTLDPFSTTLPDIQLSFLGMSPKYDIPAKGMFKAAWLYAKPEFDFNDRNLKVYNQLYTLSTIHQQAFEKCTGLKTKVLRVATNKIHKPATKAYQYDIAYMATGVEYRAQVVRALAEAGYRVAVVGSKWTKDAARAKIRANLCLVEHPNIDIIGEFWPNEEFSDFFNLAPLSIYPMQDAYVENGIVSIRILDVYASSDCLCLVRNNPGLEETFGVLPPTYTSLKDLIELVEFYLKNPEECRIKQEAVRQSLLRRYEDLVRDVIRDAKVFWGQNK